jgi:hypothetical protein
MRKLRLDDHPGYFIIKGNLIKFVEVNMSTIQIKSANLPTSVPRSRIRKAVEEAFRYYGYFQVPSLPAKRRAKKATKKK